MEGGGEEEQELAPRIGPSMATDRLSEQGQQLHLHQYLDSAEVEVQVEAEVQALARTTRKMVLYYCFMIFQFTNHYFISILNY